MPNYKRIELLCKCADLVAQDRKAYNRDVGNAGILRKRIENCMKDIAEGFRKIDKMVDK